MHGTQILTLGLGLQASWALKNQNLDMSVSPHRLELYVEAERGTLYPCPECGEACPAHDFADKTCGIWTSSSTSVTYMPGSRAPSALNLRVNNKRETVAT